VFTFADKKLKRLKTLPSWFDIEGYRRFEKANEYEWYCQLVLRQQNFLFTENLIYESGRENLRNANRELAQDMFQDKFVDLNAKEYESAVGGCKPWQTLFKAQHSQFGAGVHTLCPTLLLVT